MGSFSLGLLMISVGAWLWFWAVTGLAVARARGAHPMTGLLLCVLLGPLGLLILVLTSTELSGPGPDGYPAPF